MNYCVYNLGTDSAMMALWCETVAKRGVDEVASVIMKYITTQYFRLQNGASRKLIIWSDRCRGQVNNYPIVCLMKLLVAEGYFSEVQQKLLPTGHSYMACDRMFGLIEQRKRVSQVFVPAQWEDLIRNVCPQRPFNVVNMTQRDFYDFKVLENFIPRPRNLKVTERAWFRVTGVNASEIESREDFSPSLWEVHLVHRPNTLGRILQRPLWTSADLGRFRPRLKYNAPLPISLEKFQDLQTMIPFLLPEYRAFYQTLPH